MLLLSIERAISYLHEIEDQRTGIGYFQTMMLYIFGAKKNFSKKVGKIIMERIEKDYPEGSKVMMGIADHLREEGKEEGKLEGKKEGAKKTQLEVIQNAIDEGLRLELIAKITGLTEMEVKKIVDEFED